MAMIAAMLLFFGGVFSAAVSKQLSDEFKAWTPWWISYWIKIAVSKLPPKERARFTEEWQSDVSRIPGEIGKVCMALGCIVAAYRISALHRRDLSPGELVETNLRLYLLKAHVISLYIVVWLFLAIGLAACGFFILIIIGQLGDQGLISLIIVCSILAVPGAVYLIKEPVSSHRHASQRKKD